MRFRKPYRIKRKKSIFKNRSFWLAILFTIIISSLFYLIVFASFLQIKEIRISGNQEVQEGDLENFVWESIGRKIIVFKTKSIFLVKFSEIENGLLEKFPKIFKIDLKKKFPDTLILKIQERNPLFIFCNISDFCFYLDKEGIIFEKVSIDVGESLPKIKIINSQEVTIGEKIIEKGPLVKMREIISKLKEDSGILVKELLVSEGKIEAKTDQDFGIYFNSREDISSQIQNVILVLGEEIPPESRNNLEYIDLRFGNKIYYKYRE